ncbi:MAG: hypothetical protein DPW18_09715 [Chloroflexi bacterium]|nr:hypothetical protein [Chloroflexota bacterium]MDL1943762.1 hypothetical protein [Chloroflexi bacterium CFX2]
MKKIILLLTVFFCLFPAARAQAQTPETIWITASTTSFKTGETVIVTVNAISASPIQGITFQIRYDPACLEPVNAATSIPGMNGLSLPQTPGLLDASFASTTPQMANGVIAEARFVTLGACQTTLTLESAALVVKNESGFATPLESVTIGEKSLALSVSAEKGSESDAPLLGTPLALGVEPQTTDSPLSTGTIIVLSIIGVLLVIGIFILIRILRSNDDR